jgi:hypothetical protein
LSRYPLGQPLTIGPITVQQRNTDGTYSLVDAGTLTTVVKLAAIDGTWTTTGTYSSPAHDSLGKYHQDVPATDLTVIGHYQWAATSTGTGAGVTFGEFDVFDPFETAVLPLQDAKDQLNIPQSNTGSDAEIQSYIATIESALKKYTGGPLVNKVITAERSEMMNNQTVIPVRQRPLVSVTSITSVTGGAIDISGGLDLDINAGLIRRPLGYPFYGPFFQWLPTVNVTYVAGWGVSVPPAFNSAARIILQHLWWTQRAPSLQGPLAGGADVILPGFGFAIPNAAAELLDGAQGGMPYISQAYI